ncbi:asialoglycoprotein receptor 1-like [Polyodon spathula]|uniref:asialoglycoprotein receptor 1-like n=1 Tax=Polyodon spathula TaxID=7913 RepID=UPI001B7DB236|nr:asialoglycoprotein receptor 1-like [Polyodon spathula]
MSGEVLYSNVKFTRKPGDRAADKLCAGREGDVTYATLKFAVTPSSQQQQQTDPTHTADPTLPVSAAGKASSYRQSALVLLILSCLLLIAVISLAVYHFKTKENPEKYTSLSTNYSSLLDRLHNLSSDYSNLNKNHSELQSNNSRLQKENSELKKNNTELSVKSSILNKYCPLKEGSSKERVCCPEKWVQFNGKCYYFSTDTMDWNSSQASCVSMGADLVIIESEAEQRFLLDKAKSQTGQNSYWMGLTDAVTEGVWLWVDGAPLNDKAKYWHSKEPDDWKKEDLSGEDCARLVYEIHWANSLYTWFDASCTWQQNRRICERTAVIINI